MDREKFIVEITSLKANRQEEELHKIEKLPLVRKVTLEVINQLWQEQNETILLKLKRKMELQEAAEERRKKGAQELKKAHEKREQMLSEVSSDRIRELARERERENRLKAKQTVDLDEQNLVMSGFNPV